MQSTDTMKVRRKLALLATLALCVAAFVGCDTYYYGQRPTSHRSKVNREKTMYVHKATVDGHRDYGTSNNTKPAGKMHRQRKIRK